MDTWNLHGLLTGRTQNRFWRFDWINAAREMNKVVNVSPQWWLNSFSQFDAIMDWVSPTAIIIPNILDAFH